MIKDDGTVIHFTNPKGRYLLEVIYQTGKMVFDHISKHRDKSWKHDL